MLPEYIPILQRVKKINERQAVSGDMLIYIPQHRQGTEALRIPNLVYELCAGTVPYVPPGHPCSTPADQKV